MEEVEHRDDWYYRVSRYKWYRGTERVASWSAYRDRGQGRWRNTD